MFKFPLKNCNECPLAPAHFGQGYEGEISKADILILGEAPGRKEEETGLPFQGEGGQLFRRKLIKYGFPFNRCIISNSVLCRPPDNRTPTTKEIKCCEDNLDALIETISPKYIITAGNIPLKRMTGKTGITKYRGMTIEKDGVTILPLFHPAYILRNASNEVIWEKDIENLVNIINGIQIEKNEDDKDYYLIETIEEFKELIKIYKGSQVVSIDIEATGKYHWLNAIRSIQFSFKEKNGYFLPILEHRVNIKHNEPSEVIDKTIQEGLRETGLYNYWKKEELNYIKQELICIFEDDDSPFISGQNFKFDQKFLERWLFGNDFYRKIKNVVFDTMIASYLLDENTSNKLKDNTYLHFDDLINYAQELQSKINDKDEDESDFTKVKLETLVPYGLGDTDATFRLTNLFAKELEKDSKLERYMYEFYIPWHYILCRAERVGIGIDVDHILKTKEQYEKEMIEIENEVCLISGMSVTNQEIRDKIKEENPNANEVKLDRLIKKEILNLNSSKQLAELLFEKMKIPVIEKTPTGQPSTNSETLKILAENHPFCRKIVDFKNRSKMISTYLNGALKYAELDGTIVPGFPMTHFTMNMIGTVTGRSSSKEIAIQTIPRKKEMRMMICSPPGWYLVEFDLSQIELRLMAWYSQDPTMLKEFKENIDIHLETLRFMIARAGLDPETEVSRLKEEGTFKERRKRAKLFNFGGGYGGGATTLMHHINEKLEEGEPRVTEEDAQAHLDYWFNKYKGLGKYYDLIRQKAQKDKQVTSCFGRIRRLPELNLPDTPENKKLREEAFRYAVNSPIQGTASDLTKMAMVDMYLWLEENKMKSILSFDVHDAAFALVPKDEVYDYCLKMKEFMERERSPILKDSLEIKAEGSVMTHWGDPFDDEKLKEFKLNSKMLGE